MLDRLPWHERQWRIIEKACASDRLPHGILLSGPRGIGLNTFADQLALSLLCFSPPDTAVPCGECKSCRLLDGDGAHPDCNTIEPEDKGRQIKVETIRELIEFIQLKSQYERGKIAIVRPAESMNRAAANTLLKTLEEPPPSSVLILVSYRPEFLPVTVRSRCQQIHFQPDYSQTTQQWLQAQNREVAAESLLKMAHGAPLSALRMAEEDYPSQQETVVDDLVALYQQKQEPVAIADKWNKLGATLALQWMLDLLADLIRWKSGAVTGITDPFSRLQPMANRLHLDKLMQLYDLTLKNYGLSQSNISYNTQALLEDVIIQWQYAQSSNGGRAP